MNDYRIGNLVNDNYMVIEIDANGLGLVDANLPDDLASYIYVEYENIKPIPLTEDWILKFGFNKYGEWFIINNMFAPYINISIKHNKTTIGDNEEYDIEMIKYVHDLQNLYFALTRKELICTHDQ